MPKTLKLAVIAVLAAGSVFVGDSAQAARSRNRLASNRLASNRLASNRLASNRLASNALSSTQLEATQATAELLGTEGGRDVYSYLIGCALPDGITIQATIPDAPDTAPPDSNYTCSGGTCVFSGALGLTPDWIDHRLGAKDERWISACMFARTNAYDTADAISLRGDHPALAVSTDEAELYTLNEGSFYGNLFTHEDDPIDWNACRGADQAAGESGGLGLRDCAEPDPDNPASTYCGFTYAGDCADYTPPASPYACKTVDAQGLYGDCHNAPGDGHWPASRTYREVITVYVAQ